MEKLRHSPENLTCHSERTGFYSEGVWCAATLHRPADNSQQARPAILMVHGWGGIQNALTVPFYEEFTRVGYVVMTFDYRGWGESAGLPRQTISVRQRMRDADAALAFLKSHPSIDPRQNRGLGVFARRWKCGRACRRSPRTGRGHRPGSHAGW
ncbi:alpha/beta hydrolase [Pseudomonas sp. B392_1p]|uniref:alpha/beta hydrolase n=1 Tax=Pseudomonas sp. B392_1p TaxID=3457507 RepID=UPI003FD5BF78